MKLTSKSTKQPYFEVYDAGTLIGGFRLKFIPDKKAVELCDLNVFPVYRNKGYGTQIVKDLMESMFVTGKEALKDHYQHFYCCVDVDNPDAQRFFSKVGRLITSTMDASGRYLVSLWEDGEPAHIDPPVKDIRLLYGDSMLLKGMDEGVIHVVDELYDKFDVGDIVKVPWSEKYEVYERLDMTPWDPFGRYKPYMDTLAFEAKTSLEIANKVAVLKVRKVKTV